MSPRAVIPSGKTSVPIKSGTLPFLYSADLGSGVEIPISPVWPTPGGVTDVGYSYDHEAEVPVEAKSLVTKPNTIINLASERYRVIDVQANDFLPHVVLRLRRSEQTI
jgi:hypothetical protein